MKYDEGEGAGYWFVHKSDHNNGLPCARIHDQLKVSFHFLGKSQKEFVEDIFELVHWTPPLALDNLGNLFFKLNDRFPFP